MVAGVVTGAAVQHAATDKAIATSIALIPTAF